MRRTPIPQRERDIGRRLAYFRRDMGLTRSRLARDLGIGEERLATYELGRVPLSFEVAAILRRKYTPNLQWLATGIGPLTLEFCGVDELIKEPVPKVKFSEAYDRILSEWFTLPAVRALVAGGIVEDAMDMVMGGFLALGVRSADAKPLFTKVDQAIAALVKKLNVPNRGMGANFSTSKTKVDTGLGAAKGSVVSIATPNSWAELRAKLVELTARPGAKADLARLFAVSRQVVSKWLGKGAPDANTTIQLLNWTQGVEPQQKKAAAVVESPRRQKVQAKKVRNEKPNSDPSRK